MVSRMVLRSLALLLVLAVGCDSKKSDAPGLSKTQAVAQPQRAPLVDLTSATSLAAVREAFNARKGEARFLTLLSPT